MGNWKWGDRRDAKLIRDIDAMHYIMPLMYPNRCDNEAFMTLHINLEKTEEYIKRKNKENPDNKIAIFEIIIAATLKAIKLRPHMNRFIANNTMYQRNELTAAFTVKKNFRDDGEETLARVVADDKDTLDTINKKVMDQIEFCKNYEDDSTKAMNFIKKLPGKHFIGWLARLLDKHGLMPKSVIATDPYQCTVVLTNLGSIGMNIGYHHLMNWGTNSIFIVVGKKKKRAHYDKDGNITMRREIALSLTIDERISDGFYYARSLRLLKRLIENPELLETPLDEEVSY